MTLLQLPIEIDPGSPAPAVRQRRTAPVEFDPGRRPGDQAFAKAHAHIWLFLSVNALFIGALFGVYAVVQLTWPDALAWGHRHLADAGWGAISTVVLVLGSLTMALATRSARAGERFNLMLFLALTIMCGICFAGVKVIEFIRAAHDQQFLLARDSARNLPAAPAPSAPAPVAAKPDLAKGQRFYTMVCAACHGPGGEGMKGLGLPLQDSELVTRSTGKTLADFIKVGRQPNDPASRMKAAMPARGGAMFLTDVDIDSIVLHLRSLAKTSTPAASSAVGNAPSKATAPSEAAPAAAAPIEEVPSWFVPLAPQGPAGLHPDFVRDTAESLPPPLDPPASTQADAADLPPKDAHLFLGYFSTLAGIHLVQLLIGLGIVGWLFAHAARGMFGPACHAILSTGGLYWHVVTAGWLVLLPLLYMVG